MPLVDPGVARIFRITHIDNVRWILEHGLHCQNGGAVDPNFVQIGIPDLISSRSTRQVPIPPKGVLSDYVPFYFTPHSIMLFNIKTGMRVQKRPMEDIVIMASSLPRLLESGVSFVFTDRHANLRAADFSSDLTDLHRIDWKILRERDFKIDPNDLGKKERYQAEALVHGHMPIAALDGIVCYGATQQHLVQGWANEAEVNVQVHATRAWYF